MPSRTISLPDRLDREVQLYSDNNLTNSYSQAIQELVRCGLAFKKQERARLEEAKRSK